MTTAFRFVALSPVRIEEKKTIGAAWALHEFLVNHQTDPSGWVYYGKEFGYAWIRSKWLAAPALRTLERHMATLKAAGKVQVRRTMRGGMRVRLLDSVKFAKPIPEPAVQLPLLLPRIAPIRGGAKSLEKPEENPRNPDFNTAKSGGFVPPKVAAERSKEQVEETIKAVASAHELPRRVEMTRQQLDERRRFLLDQADELLKIKTAG